MKVNYTRGSGPLDNILARLRALKANSFIIKSDREGRILDIGCGSYPYFLASTAFKEKFGIDPSLSSEKIHGINLIKSRIDNKKLPYKDDFFDIVTMLAVFEHIEEKKVADVLKEIRRVLKKEGKLIITTPSPWSDIVLHVMARSKLISEEEIHEHKHNLSRSKIIKILEDSGFRSEETRSGYFELGFNMWFTAEK